MKRLFHTFVSVLVALPLGVGGFCCCLLGHDDRAAAPAVAEVRACCASAETPAPAEDDPGCDCPARDLAVFANGPAGSSVPELAPKMGDLVAAVPGIADVTRAAALRLSPVPHPPPKLPLRRTFSVLLC